MKSILFTIILIAVQVYIATARAQNESVNTTKNTELSTSQEFTKIKQKKLAIESNLKKQEAACYKKFAVNNCLKDAKTEAQTALNAVKRRELEINDQQRHAKAESDQSKKEKAAVKNAADNNGVDTTSEVKDKNKTVKTAKPAKTMKLEAEILAEKNAADKSRANAAQKRLVDSNQKQAASQKKTQIRVNKNSQSSLNVSKYDQKLTQAEEHKQALEKERLAKNKIKSAPLPIPTATTP